MNRVLLIAHAPLASALREAALHVFPDCADVLSAIDVQAQDAPEHSLAVAAKALRMHLNQPGTEGVLLLADVYGATPANCAHRLVDGVRARLITGVNLPMLLRGLSYRHETLEALCSRAVAGGTQGIVQVTVTAPQNQARRSHDQDHHDHQQ